MRAHTLSSSCPSALGSSRITRASGSNPKIVRSAPPPEHKTPSPETLPRPNRAPPAPPLRRPRNALPRSRALIEPSSSSSPAFRQRQQQHFIHRVRRPLAAGSNLRIDSISSRKTRLAPADPLPENTHPESRPEPHTAPASPHIGRTVANRVQVLQQFLQIENLTPPQNPRQVG